MVNCLSNLRQWGLAEQTYASDNNDGMPSDGLDRDNEDAYPGDNMQFEMNNWMNCLPQLVAEHTLASYVTNAASNAMENSRILPFPGALGKIWECPSATMPVGDLQNLDGAGKAGFFSYAMNIDLKRNKADVPPGESLPFPQEPKLSSLQKPVATVFMEEVVFNYNEALSAGYDVNVYAYSKFPSLRWRSFPARHDNTGGILTFADGHAAFYKEYYINRQQPSRWEWLNPDVIWNPAYRQLNP